MTFTCAECRTYSCRRPEHDKMPANCPMQTRKELLDQAKLAYEDPETAHFFRESALLEALNSTGSVTIWNSTAREKIHTPSMAKEK